MKAAPILEKVIYALLIIVSLIALLVVAVTPSYLRNVTGVYQAF